MITVRALSTLAFASTLDSLRPTLEGQGLTVQATLMPTALLMPQIRDGARADIALLTAEGVAALLAEGVLAPGTTRDIARSRVGIAVKAGAPHPPMTTQAELVAALRAASAIGLSRAGASGLFFAGLLERLGIAAEVQAKAVVIDTGYTAALLTEDRVDLAVQQVSELLMVSGIEVVGPLPPECGGESVFSGGVFNGAAHPEAGAAVLAIMAGAQAVLRRCGLAPA